MSKRPKSVCGGLACGVLDASFDAKRNLVLALMGYLGQVRHGTNPCWRKRGGYYLKDNMTKKLTEYDIQRVLVKQLRDEGYLVHGDSSGVFIPHMGTKKKMQAAGLLKGYPDLTIILCNGITLWIELKRKGNKPDADQILLHNQIRARGHKCEVVIATDPADAYLQVKEHIKNAIL